MIYVLADACKVKACCSFKISSISTNALSAVVLSVSSHWWEQDINSLCPPVIIKCFKSVWSDRLSYGHCHTSPCPADAQIFPPVSIDPSKAWSRPGTSSPWGMTITNQFNSSSQHTTDECKKCDNADAVFFSFFVVIANSIFYLRRVTAPHYFISVFIDRCTRWPVTGWRGEGGENKWKGSREKEDERAGPKRFLMHNGSPLLCWILIWKNKKNFA